MQRITTPAAATAIATDRAPHVIPATHQTSARSAAEHDAFTQPRTGPCQNSGMGQLDVPVADERSRISASQHTSMQMKATQGGSAQHLQTDKVARGLDPYHGDGPDHGLKLAPHD